MSLTLARMAIDQAPIHTGLCAGVAGPGGEDERFWIDGDPAPYKAARPWKRRNPR